MAEDRPWEVLPAGEMQTKYGLNAENRRFVRLNPDRVPLVLRHLIPLAEEFGISDDLIRADFLRKAPEAAVEAMRHAVEAQAIAFDQWLAGPEADGPNFSAEYIAFTCLRMAADGC